MYLANSDPVCFKLEGVESDQEMVNIADIKCLLV